MLEVPGPPEDRFRIPLVEEAQEAPAQVLVASGQALEVLDRVLDQVQVGHPLKFQIRSSVHSLFNKVPAIQLSALLIMGRPTSPQQAYSSRFSVAVFMELKLSRDLVPGLFKNVSTNAGTSQLAKLSLSRHFNAYSCPRLVLLLRRTKETWRLPTHTRWIPQLSLQKTRN